MGILHLISHSSLKALLFLSAGIIIHNNIQEQGINKLIINSYSLKLIFI